jgi:hypothetical protein
LKEISRAENLAEAAIILETLDEYLVRHKPQHPQLLVPTCSRYGNIDASTVVSTKTCFDPNGAHCASHVCRCGGVDLPLKH